MFNGNVKVYCAKTSREYDYPGFWWWWSNSWCWLLCLSHHTYSKVMTVWQGWFQRVGSSVHKHRETEWENVGIAAITDQKTVSVLQRWCNVSWFLLLGVTVLSSGRGSSLGVASAFCIMWGEFSTYKHTVNLAVVVSISILISTC